MKSIINRAILLIAATTALLSFTSKFGGEGFEISINDRLLLQQFGSELKSVKEVKLEQLSATDKLTVKYYHCGKMGKHRVIDIKDEQGKLIKEWRFADANSGAPVMNCYVNDIIGRIQSKGLFRLYYSSSELPNGRLLANIIVGNSSTVKK